MSDQAPDIMEETPEDNDLVKKLRQEIRERDNRLKEVETAKSELERRTTFRDLGIKTDEGPGALLFKAYEGELSPESIRAEAEKYGIPLEGMPAPAAQPQQSPDAAAHNAMNQASAGATPAAEAVEPAHFAQERYNEVLNKTGNPNEAMAQYFGAKLAQTLENRKRGA